MPSSDATSRSGRARPVKTVRSAYVGSNPTPATTYKPRSGALRVVATGRLALYRSVRHRRRRRMMFYLVRGLSAKCALPGLAQLWSKSGWRSHPTGVGCGGHLRPSRSGAEIAQVGGLWARRVASVGMCWRSFQTVASANCERRQWTGTRLRRPMLPSLQPGRRRNSRSRGDA
jgi:hypothetical protein